MDERGAHAYREPARVRGRVAVELRGDVPWIDRDRDDALIGVPFGELARDDHVALGA